MRELFDEDHAAFAASFRTFVERDAGEPDAFHRAGKAGLLGMQVAEQHGGGGIDDPRFCAVAIEELVTRGRVGFALAYAGHVGVGQAMLSEHATIEQQDEWLPALVAGDATVAVSADAIAGDLTGAEVTLRGGCQSVVNGAGAALALIPVRPGDQEVSLAVVPLSSDGVHRTEVDGLALADAALADLDFDDAVLPRSCLLPAPALPRLLASMRLWAGVIGVAGARTALDWTRTYVRERKVFGRPVASFENTRHALGGLAAEMMSAQAYVDDCLLRHAAQRLGPEKAVAAKLISSELFGRAADQGLQLHGGYGYMREYPISTLFADARFLRWYGGTNEDLRTEIAGTIEL
jgi:acyl-CoA dehydrogenase